MKKELNGKGWLGMKRAGNKTLKRSQLQQILQILVTKEARNETLGGATDSELLKVSEHSTWTYLGRVGYYDWGSVRAYHTRIVNVVEDGPTYLGRVRALYV